ncbi:MAG: hypothetical protein QXQ53_03870 [Candidatus Methanosuratincola sp.]
MANILKPSLYPQPKRLKTGTIIVGTTVTQGPNVTVAPGREVVLSCPSTNSASVFVGDSEVTPTNGLEIEPGGGVLVCVSNLNQLYFISTAANQTVRYAVEVME